MCHIRIYAIAIAVPHKDFTRMMCHIRIYAIVVPHNDLCNNDVPNKDATSLFLGGIEVAPYYRLLAFPIPATPP